jgi:hypothetical protein
MIEPKQYTDDELIDAMIQFYKDMGYWPKLRDMKTPYPGKTTYARRFASGPGKDDGFGNALKLAQERYDQQELEALSEALDKINANKKYGRFGSFVGNLIGKITGRGRE